MKDEIANKFIKSLTPGNRKIFEDLDTAPHGNEISAKLVKGGATLWYFPDMNYFFPENQQRQVKNSLKKFPKDKWLIISTETREGLPVICQGDFLDHPFDISLNYEISYTFDMDDIVGEPDQVELDIDGCDDVHCACFAMVWNDKARRLVEQKCPVKLKELMKLKAYCDYTVTEEYEWEEKYLDSRMLILFNVPYGENSAGRELEMFLKKSVNEDDQTLLILPQKYPMNYWQAWEQFPGEPSNPRTLSDAAVYYGKYGPWQKQKDHFILTAFHMLHVHDPEYEKQNGPWFLENMLHK